MYYLPCRAMPFHNKLLYNILHIAAYAATAAQPITLHLYYLTGRLLYKEILQPTIGTNSWVIDLSRYPQGMYIVTLNNGAEVVGGKVVKE